MEAASGESLVEEKRVDQAFHALRQKLARLSTECALHALCITLLWLVYELGASPGRAQAVRLAAAMCPYTLNFLIARQKIELTKLNLRISYSIYILTFVVFVLAGATSFDSTDRVAMQAFQLSCRFLMSVIFLDAALLVRGLPGREATAVWWRIQQAIEAAHCFGHTVAGVCVDIAKAFNTLPRTPVYALAVKAGLPDRVLRGWMGAVAAMTRRFQVRGSTGPPLVACVGFPEGCGMSVLGPLLCPLSMTGKAWALVLPR